MTRIPIKPQTTYLVPEPVRARFGYGEDAREGDKPLISTEAGNRGMGGGVDPSGLLRGGFFGGLNKYIKAGEYSKLPQYDQNTGKFEGDFGFTYQKNAYGISDQDIANYLFTAERDSIKRNNPALFDKARNLQAKSGFDEDSSPLKTTTLTTRDLRGKNEAEQERQNLRKQVEAKYAEQNFDLPESLKTQSRTVLAADLSNKNKATEAFDLAGDKGVVLTPEQRSQAFSTGKVGEIMRSIENRKVADELNVTERLGELKNKQRASNPDYLLLQKQDEDRVAQQRFQNDRTIRQDNIANQINLGDLDLQTTKLGLEAQQAQSNYALQMRQYEADVDYRNRRMEYDRARLGQERMDNIFKILLSGINYV
jgi:hypothetical protein